MALEITQVLHRQLNPRSPELRITQAEAQNQARRVAEKLQDQQSSVEDIRRSVDELRRVSQHFNKKLSFSFNEDLGQMVVKVIDRNTDKVIKELPPAELQRAHIRIREAIGLLLDETI